MVNTLIFLRHAEPQKDFSKDIAQWGLSAAGKQQSRDIATTGVFLPITCIFSSPEPKAIETCTPFIERFHCSPVICEDLRELERPATKLLATSEYEAKIRYIFSHRTESYEGWESVENALLRFVNAINTIKKSRKSERILVVSHGIILTILFGFLMNEQNQLYERWKMLRFCSWGSISASKLIKDIITD